MVIHPWWRSELLYQAKAELEELLKGVVDSLKWTPRRQRLQSHGSVFSADVSSVLSVMACNGTQSPLPRIACKQAGPRHTSDAGHDMPRTPAQPVADQFQAG